MGITELTFAFGLTGARQLSQSGDSTHDEEGGPILVVSWATRNV
jgi:hypothetical protein